MPTSGDDAGCMIVDIAPGNAIGPLGAGAGVGAGVGAGGGAWP